MSRPEIGLHKNKIMTDKSKLFSGFTKSSYHRSPSIRFTTELKHKMILDYLNSDLTKRDIWEKYTGRQTEHGKILSWMRELGYDDSVPQRITSFVSNPLLMKKKELAPDEDSFETIQLKKKIAELEQQVSDSEMRAAAFSTMVDLAEKEFNISIRKKYNTKPLKK